jgi:hypothetical protein
VVAIQGPFLGPTSGDPIRIHLEAAAYFQLELDVCTVQISMNIVSHAGQDTYLLK